MLNEVYRTLVVLFTVGTIGINWIWFILGLLVVAGGGWTFKTNLDFNKLQFPALYETWQKSWMCNKCGNVYASE